MHLPDRTCILFVLCVRKEGVIEETEGMAGKVRQPTLAWRSELVTSNLLRSFSSPPKQNTNATNNPTPNQTKNNSASTSISICLRTFVPSSAVILMTGRAWNDQPYGCS
mmetsp:Transcript_48922/g.118449  ORF Transcript_48922/g.118449 Transcript_48922/m.118449 type:complete len:109 (-) Transcript_48922:4447-4773(-)